MNTEERLTQVERQLRWLKRLGALAIAVGAVVVLVAQAKEEEPQDLVVRSLTVKDAEGAVRARVALNADGSPGVGLADGHGTFRTLLVVAPDGSPGLLLNDKDGGTRARFALMDGSPLLLLEDQEGRRRASLHLSRASDPVLKMFDANGKVIWKAPGE